MSVDLNPSVSGKRSVATDFGQLRQMGGVSAGQVKVDGVLGPSLVVTENLPWVQMGMLEFESGNPARDDDLGIMVMSAFDLKPPEVPDFV